MGLSGFVGSGVQDALSQQLMEQLRVAALAEEQRQALEREAMASREQARRESEDRAMADYRTQALDEQGRARRDRANQAGVEDLFRQGQMLQEQEAAQAQQSALADVLGTMPEGPGKRLINLQRLGAGKNLSAADLMTPDEAAQERAAKDKADIARAAGIANAQEAAAARYRPAPVAPGTTNKTTATAERQQNYALESANAIVAKVDALVPRIGVMTAGPIGEVLRHAPGTPAANVAADLESLASNLAFNELTKMRAASPTGGALGNVSDRETALLTSVVASVRQNQSPDNLRRNLAAIKASAERIKKAAEIDAGLGGMTPSPGHGTEADQGGGVAGLSYADYLRRRK